jgi:hypothetical protein
VGGGGRRAPRAAQAAAAEGACAAGAPLRYMMCTCASQAPAPHLSSTHTSAQTASCDVPDDAPALLVSPASELCCIASSAQPRALPEHAQVHHVTLTGALFYAVPLAQPGACSSCSSAGSLQRACPLKVVVCHAVPVAQLGAPPERAQLRGHGRRLLPRRDHEHAGAKQPRHARPAARARGWRGVATSTQALRASPQSAARALVLAQVELGKPSLAHPAAP